MRLVKIQDLSSRPITSIELVSSYLFGDTMPKEFMPRHYTAGEYTYRVNSNGTVTVYYCLTTGYYTTIDKDNWTVASVPDIVSKLLADYVNTSKDISDKEVVQSGKYSYKTYTDKDGLICRDDMVTLPFTYDHLRHHIEVYVNDIRKSELNGEYVFVDANTIQLSRSLTSRDIVAIDVLFKEDEASRLIYTLEYHPTSVELLSDNTKVFMVEVPEHLTEKSLVFDVYANGLYVSDSYYTYYYDPSSNAYIIKISNKFDTGIALEDINVVFTCSLSKEVTITKTDVKHIVMSDPAQFQLDMKYTDFKDISIIYNTYREGYLIPNNATVIQNSKVNITDEEYYLNPAETLVVTYKNIIVNSIFDNDHEASDDYHEVVYVTEEQEETKQIPVPFVGFDPDCNTLLVFKGSGYLVSSTRYYIKDGVLTFFPHDDSIVEGDKLIFQIINNDNSVCGYTKVVTLTQDDLDNGIKLDQRGFDVHKFDPIVFTTTGMYIPNTDYTISNGVLKLTTTSGISVGDTLELVLFEYIKTASNTMMRLYDNKVSSSTEVTLPFSYNENTDNIIILRPSGMYVDKSRYVIKPSGLVELTSGTPFNKDEIVDIALIRTFKQPESLLTILKYR